MEPLNPTHKVRVLEGLSNVSKRDFANPKSPTWVIGQECIDPLWWVNQLIGQVN